MIRFLQIIFMIHIVLFPMYLTGQVHYITQELPVVQNNIKGKISTLTDEKKIKLLSLLPEGDRIEFESPNSSLYDDEVTEYFPLDTFGLNYIDLNFDGQLDLIYSSQSGNMGISSSKVYIYEAKQLKYHSRVSGGLLHIAKIDNSFDCYFVWYPCCDSYTARISKYTFSKNKIAEKKYIISIIGLRSLKGLPDFDSKKIIKITDCSLYANPQDFKLTVPYFKERNKNIKDSLRAGHNIKLIDLKGEISCNILKTRHAQNETWHLVITETLNDLPKSLYEWSTGNKRRLIGWVKKEGK